MTYRSVVELRHLRYFIAVAKHGSFNRAAQALHLTQPALSRQVKDLEEELTVPLLVRGKNAVTLTAEGEFFYEEAREILSRTELAIQRVRKEAPIEVLRVGYAPSATTGILPEALQRFRAQHPRVKVELADLFPQDMARKVRDGELDLVVTLEAPGAKAPNFHWEELWQMHVVLAMPADHGLAKLKRIPPQRLQGVPLVGLAPETFPQYLPHIRKMLRPFGVKPHFVALERDGVATMFASMEAFHAAAILAESAVGFMPRTLVCRPFAPAFEPIVAKVGWSAQNSKASAVAFAELLRKVAQRKRKGAARR